MRRTLGLCFLVCVLLFGCATPVCASQLTDDLWEEAGLSRLFDILPQDLPQREELINSAREERLIDEDFVSSFIARFFDLARAALAEEVRLFVRLLLVLVCAMFFSAVRQAWFRESVGDAVDFLSVLVLSGSAYYALYSSFLATGEVLHTLTGFLGSMLPIQGALYTLSGAVSTATVQNTLFLTALSVLEAVTTEYLLPVLCACFALSAANAVSGVDFSGFLRFLRRTVSFSLTGFYVLLLFLLSIQSALAASSDNLALRSARFAAANFIPAVGSMFSESAKTVFSAIGLIRSSVGVLGVVCVLWIILSPILSLILRRTVFSLLSSFSQAFSLEREGRFLSECADTVGLLMGVVFSVGVFFLLGFGVFIRLNFGGA